MGNYTVCGDVCWLITHMPDGKEHEEMFSREKINLIKP